MRTFLSNKIYKLNNHKFQIFSFLIFIGMVTTLQAQNYQWVKGIGSAIDEGGSSICSDAVGNTYTTGSFSGTIDFDPSSSTFNLSSSGGSDAFILKLDSNGNFIWAKPFGGIGNEGGKSIAIDTFGNIYITGQFNNTADFNPGTGIYNLTASGSYDVFISKLDGNGNFIWAKALGGPSYDDANSLCLDISGNVYSTGYFQGTADFDPGIGTYNLTSSGFSDIFISKLDTNGNFIWANAISPISITSITTDNSGNVYTIGYFQGLVDFDPGLGTLYLNSSGSDDIFISKLDTNGNFIWAKKIGGSVGSDVGNSIKVDGVGNIYSTGYFRATVDFDPGPGSFILTSGTYDIFVLKLDTNGNFIWAKNMGGVNADYGNAIGLDALGNVYTTGYYNITADFDPNSGTFNLTSAGLEDIFISKLDTNGNFIWAASLGGANTDNVTSINIDDFGNVYTSGYYSNTADFDPSANTVNLTSNGGKDIFIHKMGQSSATSNNDNEKKLNILIFPNPSTGQFTFNNILKGSALQICDVTGRLIYQTVSQNTTETIDLSTRDKGIYMYKIISDKSVIDKELQQGRIILQ